MLEAAVIADDLTGAADTGIQFAAGRGPAWLLGLGDATTGPAGARMLSVYTSSRALSAVGAFAAVHQAARMLAVLEPRVIYKKMDSALRGNLGAELDAMLDGLGRACAFVAPAFPEQGRTTINDEHRLNGVPVHETEMGRDPMTPVAASGLSGVVAAQSRRSVGRVDLEVLGRGLEATAEAVNRLLNAGTAHICFDAAARSDLDLIVELALLRFPQALLAGSAGLAGSLAARLPRTGDPAGPDAPAPRAPVLWTCGSASGRMREQFGLLEARGDVVRWELTPTALTGSADDLPAAAPEPGAGGLIVNVAPPQPGGPPAATILNGLSAVAARLLNDHSYPTIFLSGGDTAEAVFKRLGVTAVRLVDEPVRGLIQGILSGGAFDGRTVVVKPGSFGDPDALIRLLDIYLR